MTLTAQTCKALAVVSAMALVSGASVSAATTCNGVNENYSMEGCLSFFIDTTNAGNNPVSTNPLSSSNPGTFDLFGDGMAWYTLNEESNGNSAYSSSYGAFTASFTPSSGSNHAGTWGVNFWPTTSEIAFVIKASNKYVTYLMDRTGDLTGAYNQTLLGNGPAAISSLSVWIKGTVTAPPDAPVPGVPLPAAGWMLLAGAGALGGLRATRKKS